MLAMTPSLAANPCCCAAMGVCQSQHCRTTCSAGKPDQFLLDTCIPRLPALSSCVCRIVHAAAKPDDVRWLPGARLNIAECAVCTRDEDALALLWADEKAPKAVHAVSRGQLRWRSLQVAAALSVLGLQAGEGKAAAHCIT